MHIFMGTHATEEMRSTFEPSVVFMKFPREGKHFATPEGQSFPLEDMLTRKRATRIPMSILEGAARGLLWPPDGSREVPSRDFSQPGILIQENGRAKNRAKVT
jgi:hypothetical protein